MTSMTVNNYNINDTTKVISILYAINWPYNIFTVNILYIEEHTNSASKLCYPENRAFRQSWYAPSPWYCLKIISDSTHLRIFLFLDCFNILPLKVSGVVIYRFLAIIYHSRRLLVVGLWFNENDLIRAEILQILDLLLVIFSDLFLLFWSSVLTYFGPCKHHNLFHLPCNWFLCLHPYTSLSAELVQVLVLHLLLYIHRIPQSIASKLPSESSGLYIFHFLTVQFRDVSFKNSRVHCLGVQKAKSHSWITWIICSIYACP